jgi:hypothetical protein
MAACSVELMEQCLVVEMVEKKVDERVDLMVCM